MRSFDEAETGILAVLKEHGPVGWYVLEMRVAVPRQQFRGGYNVMTYIEDLIAAGLVQRTEDGKFELTSRASASD